jgi:hypothetical protein
VTKKKSTSEKNETYGGAERVKRKEKMKIKLRRGETTHSPRIRTN